MKSDKVDCALNVLVSVLGRHGLEGWAIGKKLVKWSAPKGQGKWVMFYLEVHRRGLSLMILSLNT